MCIGANGGDRPTRPAEGGRKGGEKCNIGSFFFFCFFFGSRDMRRVKIFFLKKISTVEHLYSCQYVHKQYYVTERDGGPKFGLMATLCVAESHCTLRYKYVLGLAKAC